MNTKTQNTIATQSQHPIPMAISLIAAGPAAEMGEDFVHLDINKLITGGREGFAAFELTGDSADPDIRHGNIMFVDTWAQPVNGEMVAVMVNGLTCVKKFEYTPGRSLYLVSRNAKYVPREVLASDDFHVLGVYRGHLAVCQR